MRIARLVGAFGIALLVVSCKDSDQLPECPVDWTKTLRVLYPGTGGAIPLSQVSPISLRSVADIPEYNDCQRFLVERNGGLGFDSLFAIFARFKLDSIPLETADTAVAAPGVNMATILSFKSKYAPLGIEADFNCLVFFRNPGPGIVYEARMVPVGDQPVECRDTPHMRAQGFPLQVDRIEHPGGAPTDYPPVSRWDWDSTHVVQYIGIRCGNAWCEVHRPETSGTFASSQHYPNAPALTPPVFAVKGWYDEQRLADHPNSGGPVVSAITGTLIPHPDLGKEHGDPDKSSFKEHTWKQVAWVAIDQPPGKYAQKFNLVKSTVSEKKNEVSLCFGATDPVARTNPCFPNGDIPSCAKNPDATWWARIGQGPMTKPYCVIRRAHDGMIVPGVVRWRWVVDDDTMWVRCLDGCCEVQGDK